MQRPLVSVIAFELLSQIKSGDLIEIPSARDLAAQRKIAYTTAWRVLQSLSKQGAISLSQGMRSTISTPRTNKEPIGAGATLYVKLKTFVTDGVYKTGKPLPKALFIAASEKVSTATVSMAFRLLEKDGFAHRKSRRWIAGPAPLRAFAAGRQPAQRPMVILQTFSLSDWQGAFETHHLASFMISLRDELADFGLGLMPVVDPNAERPMKGHPAWWTDPEQAVRLLGDRYKGAVAFAANPTYEYFGTYLARLCKLGKPLVYFDGANDNPGVGRGLWGINNQYYRFWFDHGAAAKVAVEGLAAYGHRRVGVYGSGMANWARDRVALLREAADRCDKVMEFVEIAHIEDLFIDKPGETALSSFMHQLDTESLGPTLDSPRNRARDEARERLRESSPMFVDLVESGVTALVCLNDHLAWKIFFALQGLGLNVPRDISLVSFDNEPSATLYPISTVDFGFPRLAYQAAHLIIGDIAVISSRTEQVPCRPFLVDRGSIGPCRL